MVKNKTSKKQKFSFKAVNTVVINGKSYQEYDPLATLLNEDNILAAIAECVEAQDLKGATGIVNIYKEARRDARKIAKAKAPETESNQRSVSSDYSDCNNLVAGYGFSARSKS